VGDYLVEGADDGATIREFETSKAVAEKTSFFPDKLAKYVNVWDW
jgi:hypothetical protein